MLADGFYERAGNRGGANPYRIHRADVRPLAMAGLWHRWTDGDDTLETVTIVTCDANDVVAHVHDRMPVILEPGAERAWLDAPVDDAQAQLRPYPGDDLQAYPVSSAVNDPATDHPSLLERADRGEQAGLDAFGS